MWSWIYTAFVRHYIDFLADYICYCEDRMENYDAYDVLKVYAECKVPFETIMRSDLEHVAFKNRNIYRAMCCAGITELYDFCVENKNYLREVSLFYTPSFTKVREIALETFYIDFADIFA